MYPESKAMLSLGANEYAFQAIKGKKWMIYCRLGVQFNVQYLDGTAPATSIRTFLDTLGTLISESVGAVPGSPSAGMALTQPHSGHHINK